MGRRGKPASLPVPKAAAERISLYLRYLEALQSCGATTTSSQQLGAALGITAAQVRKDLGYFGQFGSPGVGYKISSLVPQIRHILGTDRTWNAALVGIGNLGTALAQYKGFEKQGFRITALFDKNPQLHGKSIQEREIRPLEETAAVIRRQDVKLGIIAVPASSAQEVADLLVSSGIRGIFNFAPVVLNVPTHVAYVSIDLAVQLEKLSFYVTQSEIAEGGCGSGRSAP